MKKIALLLICFISLMNSHSVIANEIDNSDATVLGGPITLSGDLSTNANFGNGSDDSLGETSQGFRTRGLIRLTGRLSEDIKAVVGVKLDHIFSKQGVKLPEDFDIEKWIEEAYITIKNVGGAPVIFIAGKHRIAFGQNISEMPMFNNLSPIYEKTRYDEVYGFTLALQNIPFFDLVEISQFETDRGDLDIGHINGSSVRLTKQLTREFKTEVSYINRDNERAVSLGFVFDNGEWTTWAEGLYESHNEIAVTVGAAHDLGPGRVVVEGTYIYDSLLQLGVGYKIKISDHITIGPEIRYTYEYDKDDSWSIGMYARYSFYTKYSMKKKRDN